MWNMLKGESPCVNSKLEFLCRFFIDTLYLRNPDENTRARAVALVMACSRCEMDKQVAHTHIVHVRNFMENIRTICKGEKGPKSYPETPEEFRDMYPDTKLFITDPPVACTLDIVGLMTMFGQIPQRGSHRDIRDSASSSSKAKLWSKSSSGDHMAEFGNFLMGNHMATSLQQLPKLTYWLQHGTQCCCRQHSRWSLTCSHDLFIHVRSRTILSCCTCICRR